MIKLDIMLVVLIVVNHHFYVKMKTFLWSIFVIKCMDRFIKLKRFNSPI